MPGSPGEVRDGEVTLSFDPLEHSIGQVTAIGTIRSPWAPGQAPKSIAKARETGKGARIELVQEYALALTGLSVGQGLIVLTWMDRARRDLVLQQPRHTDGPRGTFALRSPARPNPIGLATVRITGLDPAAAMIQIDATDCFDGTPVLDIKPWIPTIDLPPEP